MFRAKALRFVLLVINIISSRISIIYFYALKFTFNSPVRIHGIHSVRYDSIKGQVQCIQTLTAQVEAPSLETSKFSLYFSGSCIPTNPKLWYILPPEFLVVFNRLQCKKYQIFDEKFQTLACV
jgi:hypothetical protein